MAKVVNFVIPLGLTDRIRHYHRIERGQIEQFTVQQETFIKDKWYVVVRYDTAHGFAHRDLVHPDGSAEKLPLGISSFNEALTFAENDVRNNWKNYKFRFLREFKNE
jgi:hypothetical protein